MPVHRLMRNAALVHAPVNRAMLAKTSKPNQFNCIKRKKIGSWHRRLNLNQKSHFSGVFACFLINMHNKTRKKYLFQ